MRITWSNIRTSLYYMYMIRIMALMTRASENILRLQCKRGSSKWASPHHKQFATFLRNFYIFKQLLGNFEIWASVRRTQRTLFSDALLMTWACKEPEHQHTWSRVQTGMILTKIRDVWIIPLLMKRADTKIPERTGVQLSAYGAMQATLHKCHLWEQPRIEVTVAFPKKQVTPTFPWFPRQKCHQVWCLMSNEPAG